MVIVIKKKHTLILLCISGLFTLIHVILSSFFFASMLQSVLRYYSRHLLVSLSKHQLLVCDTVQNETWIAINNYIPTLLVLNYT